jgi:hypothetical protein
MAGLVQHGQPKQKILKNYIYNTKAPHFQAKAKLFCQNLVKLSKYLNYSMVA